jgi:endonuclease G
VFRDDDPDYRGAKVPMSFWKIVARVEEGQLKATALLAPQTARVEELANGTLRLVPGGGEGFGDLGEVKHYQVSVKHVEELTGLDFGPLAGADTLQGGGEAIGVEAARREVRTLADVRF